MHHAIGSNCQSGGNVSQDFFYILRVGWVRSKSPPVKHSSFKSTKVE